MINAHTIMRMLLILSLGITGGISQGQTLKRNCGTHDHMESLMKSYPTMRQAQRRISNHRTMVAKGDLNAINGKIIIPVVVHVVYNTPEQNLSEQQIYSQIKVLNQDYQRTNPDRFSTPEVFRSVASASNIEFKLATRDPDGNPTTGIVRTRTAKNAFYTSNNAIKFSNMGGSDTWPTDEYLNIWVGPLGLGVLGYAQFPGGPKETDGVVINYKAFGTMGTVQAPFTLGRTATHEVGHWLNLKHISGDGPCGVDDGVDDTPATDRQHYGCMEGYSSCGSLDMTSNFMDYSDDGCMNLFTKGQANRMRSLFAPGGFRHSILSSRGLQEVVPVATLESPKSVKIETVTDKSARISWEANSGVKAYLVRLRRSGNDRWISRQFNRNFVNAGKLRACSEYEVQIASIVGDDVSDFSTSRTFFTQGCLQNGTQDPMVNGPSNIKVSNMTPSSARLAWDDVNSATDYKVQYKIAGAKQVYSKKVKDPAIMLAQLKGGQRYLFRVRANEGEVNGAYSPVSNFTLPSTRQRANMRMAEPVEQRDTYIHAKPIPTQKKIEIELEVLEPQEVRVWVTDLTQKRIVMRKKIYQVSPHSSIVLDLKKYPRERYYIEVEEIGGFLHQLFVDLR
ncbi:MAG: M43 family zinc metalloprotease [Bacteroidota bacterium]